MSTASRPAHPARDAPQTWLARRPVAAYFLLAYALSWSVELPLAASAQGWIAWRAPLALHYLAAYGPLLAAVLVTLAGGGPAALRDLGARMTRWRVPAAWWIAALAPLLLYLLCGAALRGLRGVWPDPSPLGRLNFLPDLGAGAWLLWLVTYGIGEETGWRGFALPHLQRRASALTASLIVAGFWTVWHVPSFLYLPTYRALGAAVLPWFALGIVAGSVAFTWLYNGTGGSILVAAVGHATLNFVTGAPGGDPVIAAVVSTAVVIWAVVVILAWKPATLARAGKQVAGPRDPA